MFILLIFTATSTSVTFIMFPYIFCYVASSQSHFNGISINLTPGFKVTPVRREVARKIKSRCASEQKAAEALIEQSSPRSISFTIKPELSLPGVNGIRGKATNPRFNR